MSDNNMIFGSLDSSMRNAQDMMQMLDSNPAVKLPEWWTAKMAVSSAMLVCLREAMLNATAGAFGADLDADKPPNYMVRANLMSAMRATDEMMATLQANPQFTFPEWWKSKLYVTTSMMRMLRDTMAGVLSGGIRTQ